MRQIIFRGISKESGRFIYGFLSGNEDGFFIGTHGSNYNFELVDPNTIGQFTGLQDKDNEDLYEGDIYEVYSSGDFYVIFFKGGCFCGGKNYEDAIPLSYTTDEGFHGTSWLKKVGNIYENSDLL